MHLFERWEGGYPVVSCFIRTGSINLKNSILVSSRKNPFGLFVALNVDGRASGSLFWDDGETYGERSFAFRVIFWSFSRRFALQAATVATY